MGDLVFWNLSIEANGRLRGPYVLSTSIGLFDDA